MAQKQHGALSQFVWNGSEWVYTYTDDTALADGAILSFGVDPDAEGGAATIDQEGFRWRNDNGSESTATWAAAQDVDVTKGKETTIRLRVLLDVTGIVTSEQFQLEFKKNGDADSEYEAVS